MEAMDTLVVGSGGREYELARQLSLSSSVAKVYVAPGNAGTTLLDKGENVAIGPTDVTEMATFVKERHIQLTVLGPDAAVAAGMGNVLREANCLVFGPTKEAGKLEASKAFAADFMNRHQIPQPPSQVVHSLDEAMAAIKDRAPDSYVLKADGLAAGKGVVLPKTVEESEQTLRDMFGGTLFEGAGKDAVVIQERLHGPEVSAFAISDGTNFVLLPLSQDHKRLKDGDEGPNTGGMGAYAPLPANIVNATQAAKIKTIVEQSIAGAAADGMPYQGVLYLGLMLAEERGNDPVVIEYNARFGDPEAEVILPILSEAGYDVADMLLQAAKGDVTKLSLPDHFTKTALTVAVAATGYPDNPRKGDAIMGLDKTYENVVVQHAGTKQEGNAVVTAGGRVLYVTGLGETADEAAAAAYAAIGTDGIHFDGMQYRTDIGHQIRSK